MFSPQPWKAEAERLDTGRRADHGGAADRKVL